MITGSGIRIRKSIGFSPYYFGPPDGTARFVVFAKVVPTRRISPIEIFSHSRSSRSTLKEIVDVRCVSSSRISIFTLWLHTGSDPFLQLAPRRPRGIRGTALSGIWFGWSVGSQAGGIRGRLRACRSRSCRTAPCAGGKCGSASFSFSHHEDLPLPVVNVGTNKVLEAIGFRGNGLLAAMPETRRLGNWRRRAAPAGAPREESAGYEKKCRKYRSRLHGRG